jgi:hypothetical protein
MKSGFDGVYPVIEMYCEPCPLDITLLRVISLSAFSFTGHISGHIRIASIMYPVEMELSSISALAKKFCGLA